MKKIKDWISDEAPFIGQQILMLIVVLISEKLFFYLDIKCELSSHFGVSSLGCALITLFSCIFGYVFLSWSSYINNIDCKVAQRRSNRLNNERRKNMDKKFTAEE